jgi:predicted amidohydrolase
MKIAIAQINPIIGDFNYNSKKIKQFADKAATSSCDLAIFSELVVPGYPPRDLLEKRDFVDANIACLNKLVEFIRDIGVICGYVARNPADGGKYLFNSAALFENGKILHEVHKRLLPTYDVFDESRYFHEFTKMSRFFLKKIKNSLNSV